MRRFPGTLWAVLDHKWLARVSNAGWIVGAVIWAWNRATGELAHADLVSVVGIVLMAVGLSVQGGVFLARRKRPARAAAVPPDPVGARLREPGTRADELWSFADELAAFAVDRRFLDSRVPPFHPGMGVIVGAGMFDPDYQRYSREKGLEDHNNWQETQRLYYKQFRSRGLGLFDRLAASGLASEDDRASVAEPEFLEEIDRAAELFRAAADALGAAEEGEREPPGKALSVVVANLWHADPDGPVAALAAELVITNESAQDRMSVLVVFELPLDDGRSIRVDPLPPDALTSTSREIGTLSLSPTPVAVEPQGSFRGWFAVPTDHPHLMSPLQGVKIALRDLVSGAVAKVEL